VRSIGEKKKDVRCDKRLKKKEGDGGSKKARLTKRGPGRSVTEDFGRKEEKSLISHEEKKESHCERWEEKKREGEIGELPGKRENPSRNDRAREKRRT